MSRNKTLDGVLGGLARHSIRMFKETLKTEMLWKKLVTRHLSGLFLVRTKLTAIDIFTSFFNLLDKIIK